MTPQASIEQWLAYLSQEKRCSQHTVSAYERDINRFINVQLDSLEAQLTSAALRKVVAQLSKSGLSPRSVARAASALRSFVAWAISRGILPSDFALPKLSLPKLNKPLPKVIDVDTAKVAVEIKGDSPKDLRDRALLEVIYGCGIRLAETLTLKTSSVIQQGTSIRVLGKGNKERIIPLGKHAKRAIEQWAEARSELSPPTEHFFINLKTLQPLSSRGVQYIIKQRGLAAGIDISLHPHLFRHAFASHILESSGDLRAVQELLGHENLSTTQVYTHLNFQHLADVYDQAHPRAKKRDV